MTDAPGRDFFISYTASDVAWAEWIAVTLDRAGLSVRLQKWDFRPGGHFAHLMQRAAQETRHTVAVLSPRYLTSAFGESEWLAAFVQDPLGEDRRLIPVRIEPCDPPGLLAGLIHIDLVGIEENLASEKLLTGIAPDARVKPSTVPFPGRPAVTARLDDGPTYPGIPADRKEAVGSVVGNPPDDHATSPRSEVVRLGAGRTPWEWLSWKRPRIAALLPGEHDLVGHRVPLERIHAGLADSDTAALILLTGPAGSGKSSILRRLEDEAGGRFVDADATARMLTRPLHSDGEDVGRFLRALRPAAVSASEHAVLVFDDIDHHLREPGIAKFVQEAIGQLDVGLVVLSMSTPLTPQLFPVPVTDLVLDRRRADAEELSAYIDRVLDAAGVDRGTFDTDLRRSLHDLLEQTTNFRAFQYVVEMLLAHHHWKVGVHRPADLRQLLEHDLGARRLPLPAVRSQRGQRLMFRRKDKSELLADAMLRHFPTPQAVADAAATEIGDFDPAAFLAEADHSFIDAVLSLCLIYSPRDLVLLLGQDEIQQEIDALHLDPAQLFADRGSKAHLLVRGLGFTLMEKPKGLADFAEAVRAAQDLVDDDTARTNVVSAAGLTVLQHVRSALLDVLHFWATSLFGSVRELVRTVNAVSPHQQAIDSRQLEIPQLVQLLRYLLDTSVDATSIYRLAFPGDGTPVSDALLSACDAFVLAAEQFRSTPRSLKVDGPSDDFRARCAKLAAAAADVLEAGKSSFPAVIKLSEIVFDEYGRKIFRGVDSDNHEVRFTLAGDEERDELLVARHYYMLPKKPVSVNPHIVPRGGQAVQVLFDRAEAYDAASLTQRLQADRLLGLMHLSADDNVLDVGTGTGTLAVEIGSRVRRVHGIDKSPAMVRRAEEHARAARSTNVTFEVADLLRYDVPSGYDVVLSNATMHWILPPDAAYAQLFRLIRPGGRIGVHQGGHGNYEGLHRFTRGLLTDMNLGQFFQGFLYPVYYPSAEAFRDLLEGVGFVDVEVTAVVTDGSELPDLLRNFAEAGLLPYLRQLPEVDEESFRAEWLEEAQDGVTDRYTHRLYATAQRP